MISIETARAAENHKLIHSEPSQTRVNVILVFQMIVVLQKYTNNYVTTPRLYMKPTHKEINRHQRHELCIISQGIFHVG